MPFSKYSPKQKKLARKAPPRDKSIILEMAQNIKVVCTEWLTASYIPVRHTQHRQSHYFI